MGCLSQTRESLWQAFSWGGPFYINKKTNRRKPSFLPGFPMFVLLLVYVRFMLINYILYEKSEMSSGILLLSEELPFTSAL